MRDITVLSTDKVKVKSEIDLIIQHIGGNLHVSFFLFFFS